MNDGQEFLRELYQHKFEEHCRKVRESWGCSCCATLVMASFPSNTQVEKSLDAIFTQELIQAFREKQAKQ